MLEQDRADPAPLVRVRDVEGDLRRLRIDPVEAAHTDHLVAHDQHEGDARAMVDGDEPVQILRGDLRHGGEEAQVHEFGDCARCIFCRDSESDGTMGRRWAVPPSRRTTSASQWAG